MAVEYVMVDWEKCLLTRMPDAKYTGHQIYSNQSGYVNDIVWTDPRPKPTWDDIILTWTHPTNPGSGVLHRHHSPGDDKINPISMDHGNWLYVPPNGRTLNKIDYAMLYHVFKDAFNPLYPSIANTDFGLPIPGGRVRIVSDDTHPLGSSGGAFTHTMIAAEMPLHDHDLLDDIVKQSAGLTLFGMNGLLGAYPAGKIGSTQRTATAGNANPTPISLMQPYWVAGNLFVYRGELKYDGQGGTAYF